jgi:hypothetical protein
MRRGMTLGAALACGLLPMVVAQRGEAQNVVNAVRAVAQPSRYAGHCPTVINFTATIYVNRPSVVTYRWERSDQAAGPVQSVNVAGGSQTVGVGWQLSGPSGVPINGWQVLHVLSPGDLMSNTASYTLTCQ